MTDAVDDLRYVYVHLRDAADEYRVTGDTEFEMGVAHGYDSVADVLKAILDRHE